MKQLRYVITDIIVIQNLFEFELDEKRNFTLSRLLIIVIFPQFFYLVLSLIDLLSLCKTGEKDYAFRITLKKTPYARRLKRARVSDSV